MRARQTRRRWEVEACFSFALVQGDAAAAALRDAQGARQLEGERLLHERWLHERRQRQQSSGLYSSIRSTLGILNGGGGAGRGGGEVIAMECGEACVDEKGAGGGGDTCRCSHGGGGGGGGCAILEAIKSSPRHMVRPFTSAVKF